MDAHAPDGARLLAAAAAPQEALVAAAAPASTDLPTPCEGWDLGTLARHLLYWTPMLAQVGRRQQVVPTAGSEEAVVLDDGWPSRLRGAREDLVAAWSRPEAWEGSARFMGPDPFPAVFLGDMVLTELVLHSWDLATALGEPVAWPDEVEAEALAALQRIGPMGREMGAFGPEVAVPPDALVLHRALGLAGRDPARWSTSG